MNKKGIKIAGAVGLGLCLIIAVAIFTHQEKLSGVAQIPVAEASEVPGWWLEDYFGRAVCEMEDCKPNADPDADKLTNRQEFYYHTDPLDANTVDDPLNDGELVAKGFDPSRSGQVTFEQAMHEDNIMAESLLLDKDIKEIASESLDISKVYLPLVPETELRVTHEQTAEVYGTYFSDLNNTVGRYFSKDELDEIKLILESGSESEVADIRFKSYKLAADLKKITVPDKMLTYHQYVIAFNQLLPLVLESNTGADINSVESERWFENTQALLAVTQKLNFEQQRLELSMQAAQ